MAFDMTGADLSSLDSLSQDYIKSSNDMLAKAADLNARIKNAISKFNTTMTHLGSETTNLTGQIEQDMTALSSHAAGVSWTGRNREAFNTDLTSFGGVVAKGTAAIRQHTQTLKTKVDGEFNKSLEEFSGVLGKRMDANNEVAVANSQAITKQRELLDKAANHGWTPN